MLTYLKSVFSADDCASFARWATAATVLTSCGCLVFVVVKTHALPDATSLGGLSVFATAPYGIGKIAQAFLNRPPSSSTVTNLSAAAGSYRRVSNPSLAWAAFLFFACTLLVATAFLLRFVCR